MATLRSARPAAPPAPGVLGGAGLSRPLTILLGAAAVVVIGAGVRAADEIVAPTMLSLVLTIAVLPLVAWARKHGWPGWAGTLLSLVAACAIVLGLVLGLGLAAFKLVELLPTYASSTDSLQADGTSFLHQLGVSPETADTVVKQLDPSRLLHVLTDFLGALLGTFGNIFFVVTLLFFTCTAVPLLGARGDTLRTSKPEVAQSLVRYVRATQRYLVITAVFGAIVAVLDTGALWLLAVPLPLVWGIFSFITNFIPNIGFVLGVIPPTLLALLENGWGSALTVLLVYCGLNVVIQTFIQPRYVGATVGLSAEITFFSLVLWTFLLGPLGAVLAVPMTLLLRALLVDPDSRMAWLTPLIATRPDDVEE